MSKKIMSVMLAIFMLASLCVVGFTSASAVINTGYVVPTVTGSGEVGAKAGDEVHVILRVSNLEGRYGVNGEINTYFDNTKLEFVKPSRADMAKVLPAVTSGYMTNYNQDGAFIDKNGLMGLHVNFSSLDGYDYASHDGVVINYTFKALTDIENLNDVVYMDIVCLGIYDKAGDPFGNSEIQAGGYTNVATADNFGNYGSVSTNGGTWNPTATEPPVQIDVTALVARIADAKALAAKTDVYTAESIAALNDAITAAEAVAANPESQDQVDAQVAALQSAMDALVTIGSSEEPTTTTDDTEEPTTTDATEEPTSTDATEEPTSTDATENTTASDTTAATTTAAATTEKPSAPQTGEASTAVALMVVAIMAAGVVIFARKKAVK